MENLPRLSTKDTEAAEPKTCWTFKPDWDPQLWEVLITGGTEVFPKVLTWPLFCFNPTDKHNDVSDKKALDYCWESQGWWNSLNSTRKDFKQRYSWFHIINKISGVYRCFRPFENARESPAPLYLKTKISHVSVYLTSSTHQHSVVKLLVQCCWGQRLQRSPFSLFQLPPVHFSVGSWEMLFFKGCYKIKSLSKTKKDKRSFTHQWNHTTYWRKSCISRLEHEFLLIFNLVFRSSRLTSVQWLQWNPEHRHEEKQWLHVVNMV